MSVLERLADPDILILELRTMQFDPFDTCPRCGEEDLVICAERVHSLDGSLADDACEQISGGVVVCRECGDLTKLVGLGSAAETLDDRVDATLDRAAGVRVAQ